MNLKWQCPLKVQMLPSINFSFLYAEILLCEIKHMAIAI